MTTSSGQNHMQHNPEIESIIENAVKIARTWQHEYVLTEHLLLSMIRNPGFRKTLDKFGVEVDQFDQELDAYINSLVNLIIPDDVQP